MKEINDNHVSTRVDIEIKREGVVLAGEVDRTPAWVFAKAIELGLPLVKKSYPPVKTGKRQSTRATA